MPHVDSNYKWATCSRELSEIVAQHVHLVKIGGLGTLCGASATHSDIWRRRRNLAGCSICRDRGVALHIIS